MCLVLPDDHKCGGRCGCGSYGSQCDADRNREELIPDQQAENKKRSVYQNGCCQSLKNAYYESGFSNLPHRGETEFTSYRKSDKTECGGVDHPEGLDGLVG